MIKETSKCIVLVLLILQISDASVRAAQNMKPLTLRDLFQTQTNNQSNAHKILTTFRPQTGILYLQPQRPPHIASIVSELDSIEYSPADHKLRLRWAVIVVLKSNRTKRAPETNSSTLINSTDTIIVNNQTRTFASNKTTDENKQNGHANMNAQVSSEVNPLRWTIHLRKYGTVQRLHYNFNDTNNNLSPPSTSNASYTFTLPEVLSPDSAYELCLQSHNAGRFRSSEQIHRHFPLDARTDLAGNGNPLFLCKEIIPKFSSKFDLLRSEPPPSGRGFESNSDGNRTFAFDSTDNSGSARSNMQSDDNTTIVLNKDAADAFVMYTAISSASTSSLILVVILFFCCFRCRRPRTKFLQTDNAYQHYHYRRQDNVPHIVQ